MKKWEALEETLDKQIGRIYQLCFFSSFFFTFGRDDRSDSVKSLECLGQEGTWKMYYRTY